MVKEKFLQPLAPGDLVLFCTIPSYMELGIVVETPDMEERTTLTGWVNGEIHVRYLDLRAYHPHYLPTQAAEIGIIRHRLFKIKDKEVCKIPDSFIFSCPGYTDKQKLFLQNLINDYRKEL